MGDDRGGLDAESFLGVLAQGDSAGRPSATTSTEAASEVGSGSA